MSTKSREIRLRSRPVGMPKTDDFELAETTVGDPAAGEVLVRNIWMSVDPYMRGRMMGLRDSYVPPFEIGRPLEGGSVGQVVRSRSDGFTVGEYVMGMLGWREWYSSDGRGLMKIDPRIAPIQSFLGALGMPGLTAYVGLLKTASLKDGETVFVSAASGAVGSIACQIAKAKGCFVIGSAGSDDKVAWLESEAGVDAAFNYRKAKTIGEELARVAPNGIDVYFENVGGEHLEAALAHMRPFGRIALCGMIAQYNATEPPPGPRTLLNAIPKRVRLEGFIVSDHFDMLPDFQADMAKWIGAGKIRWRETVVEGIENAPEAFLGLFRGENLGKMLVRIGPDPAV
jgi:hypothetical protein